MLTALALAIPVGIVSGWWTAKNELGPVSAILMSAGVWIAIALTCQHIGLP